MKLIGIGAALACAGLAAPALAQSRTTEGEIVTAPLRAPRGAFELGAELGYTQGFGAVRQGTSVRDLAGAGMALGVGVGVRVSPTFSIGATGQLAGFNANEALPLGTAVRGATAGVEATFHIAPFARADPWVSVGGGYRMLWEVPQGSAPTTLTHGFELAKITVGVDLRPSEDVAVALRDRRRPRHVHVAEVVGRRQRGADEPWGERLRVRRRAGAVRRGGSEGHEGDGGGDALTVTWPGAVAADTARPCGRACSRSCPRWPSPS